jgi:hypothetical protein
MRFWFWFLGSCSVSNQFQRIKVEQAAIPELTARFRELNKKIPALVNEANAKNQVKISLFFFFFVACF